MSSKRQPHHPDPKINGEVLADIAISAQSDLDAGMCPGGGPAMHLAPGERVVEREKCPLHVCDAADSRICRQSYDAEECATTVHRIQGTVTASKHRHMVAARLLHLSKLARSRIAELEAENEALESHCNNVEYTARAARDLEAENAKLKNALSNGGVWELNTIGTNRALVDCRVHITELEAESEALKTRITELKAYMCGFCEPDPTETENF